MMQYKRKEVQMQSVPVPNQAPHNEDVLGQWRYTATYSS
jgi:hypothetical protein